MATRLRCLGGQSWLAREIIEQRLYTYFRYDDAPRTIEFLPDGLLSAGQNAAEQRWSVCENAALPTLYLWRDGHVLCELQRSETNAWKERRADSKQSPRFLSPCDRQTLAIANLARLREPREQRIISANQTATTIIVSGCSGEAPYKTMAEHTFPLMQAYAMKHGHDFGLYRMTGDRPSAWYKVAALYQVLQKYNRALWIDVDVLIAHNDKDIFADFQAESWQALMKNNTEIGPVPSTGVWLLSKEMLPVLERIWCSHHFIDHGWWDQAAIIEELGYFPDAHRPQKLCNTELSERTQFLAATWNHHPMHLDNAADPRFIHISGYVDRMPQFFAVLAALQQKRESVSA